MAARHHCNGQKIKSLYRWNGSGSNQVNNKAIIARNEVFRKMAEKEVTKVTIPENRLIEMLDSLKIIESITRGLTSFNPTYEKIHSLARRGLNIKGDNDDNKD